MFCYCEIHNFLLRHCRFFANVVYEEDTVEKEDKDDEDEEKVSIQRIWLNVRSV